MTTCGANTWPAILLRSFMRKDADVLDAGCGTGYGSSELAGAAASVTGFDVAPSAIDYARAHFAAPRFVLGSCGSMPFAPNAFDLVVAFEVIEHLADYHAFLRECARVLKHQGLLIVSSPNRLYYSESRAQTGPNPYHEHEFEAEEFVAELEKTFSNVRLLLQNRVESFAFHSENGREPAEVRIERAGKASEAHFLIGLCSFGPLPERRSFIYVPTAANLLRERERHIQLLEGQLAEKQSEFSSCSNCIARSPKSWRRVTAGRLRSARTSKPPENASSNLQNEIEMSTTGYQTKFWTSKKRIA